MKYTPHRILMAAGNRLGLINLMCNVFELQKKPKNQHRIKKDKVFGFFEDSLGNSIELLSGLRDRIKPSWRLMINPVQAVITAPSREIMELKILEQKQALNRIENYLQTFSLSFIDKEILEIGTYDGSSAYAFASLGAKRVLATDIAAYYINQTPGGVVSVEAVVEKNVELKQTREAYAGAVSQEAASRVSFIEDDISSSAVASESMDVVVSWEVLEHITKPNDAFKEMSRILKKGGFAFHEYNPFFSVDGGHSLCTLDFPWGHARLSNEDFERYLDEFRPEQKEVSLSFFQNNLNRMTQSHLTDCIEQNGLRIVSIIPWYSEEDQSSLSIEMLNQCKKIHPTAELVDLAAPIVWVLCEKI
ncbi:class I SAM-dependent methyltransferase [Patiriisocius sp. Uisw_017]|jgi:SAM-dependent methyltransferase|uniref:class I SAM-dependent methyltransferase n=1 Tax=Patiriisocius sp. Uisw_017 TaxID=3230968 RepID=UPI0039EC9955